MGAIHQEGQNVLISQVRKEDGSVIVAVRAPGETACRQGSGERLCSGDGKRQ